MGVPRSLRSPWWLCLALASGLLVAPFTGGDSRAGPPRVNGSVYRGVRLPAALSASDRKAVRLALDALYGKGTPDPEQQRRWRHDLKGLALMAKPRVAQDAVTVFFKTDRKRALHDLIVVELARGPKGLMPAHVGLHHELAQLGGVTVTRSGLAYELHDFTIVAQGEKIDGGRVPLPDLSHANRPPDDGCNFFRGTTKRRLSDTRFLTRTMWRKLCVKGGRITLGDEDMPLPLPRPDSGPPQDDPPPLSGMDPDPEDT